MREEMNAAAADLRKAAELGDHGTLQRVALEVAEVLEVVGSPPSPQEIVGWTITLGMAAYGLLTLLAKY